MVSEPPLALSLQTRDETGLEREISASTESFRTRGESLMKQTSSGGTSGVAAAE